MYATVMCVCVRIHTQKQFGPLIRETFPRRLRPLFFFFPPVSGCMRSNHQRRRDLAQFLRSQRDAHTRSLLWLLYYVRTTRFLLSWPYTHIFVTPSSYSDYRHHHRRVVIFSAGGSISIASVYYYDGRQTHTRCSFLCSISGAVTFLSP